MEDINKFGLLNSLINIINNYDEESTKLIIAKYLLKNFDRIEYLNIYEAAEECFVSRASIRRFSYEIGFENFKSLKKNKLDYLFYNNEYLENYEMKLAEQLLNMMHHCNEALSLEKELLIDKMVSCREIIFLISDIYTSKCIEFQKEMILQNKMVRIISYNFSYNQLLKKIDENSLLIVISISGGFLKKISNILGKMRSKKILITSVSPDLITQKFDTILHLKDTNAYSIKSVYHSFAIEYCLDIIANEYKNYKKRCTI